MSIAVRPDNNRNALAIHQPSDATGIAQLVEWAQAAEAAHQLAVRLVDTQFVPAAYRRKPEEATAAILAGAEVGLSPMASLRAFDNISGTPAPKAITLRAIVQSLGHDVRIDESTDQIASVSARRKGSGDWQTSTWTIQRAQQAGYPAKNPNWKTAPAAMLIARATAEVCRWIASDAIMGMPYSAEEIRDEGSSYEPKPAAQRVTAAEILGQVDQPIPPAEPIVAAPEPMLDAQQTVMLNRFNQAGITDPRAQLEFMTDIVGKPITGRDDLTERTADQIIEALQAILDTAPAGGQP